MKIFGKISALGILLIIAGCSSKATTGSVSGKVLTESGKEVKGGSFRLIPESGQGPDIPGEVKPAGTFHVTGAFGNYIVVLETESVNFDKMINHAEIEGFVTQLKATGKIPEEYWMMHQQKKLWMQRKNPGSKKKEDFSEMPILPEMKAKFDQMPQYVKISAKYGQKTSPLRLEIKRGHRTENIEGLDEGKGEKEQTRPK